MKKTVSILVLFALLLGTAWAGLGSDKAMYIGGTLNQIKENAEGKVSATNPTVFTFTSKQGSVSIPNLASSSCTIRAVCALWRMWVNNAPRAMPNISIPSNKRTSGVELTIDTV